ncbi:MAG: monooxygenase [Actinomycetes bacterium]
MRALRNLVASLLMLGGIISMPILASATSQKVSPTTTTSTTTTTPPVKTTTVYQAPSPFDPATSLVDGGKDLYHCSLIDPSVTSDQFITSSEILPDKVAEFHHAILFLVTPAQAAHARQLDQGGQGWTCFGAPLDPSGSFDGTPWLGAWVPGHGPNVAPVGTGVPMPAGALIVEQIHYNLLNVPAGDSTADQSSVRLTTTPQAGSSLKAITTSQFIAPPDLPCPKKVTGPLCSRDASLQDLVARFGQAAKNFVDNIEWICQHHYEKLKPATGTVSTTCTLPIAPGVIRQVSPHMHLIGAKQKVDLLMAAGGTKALVSVPHYSFDGQVTYDLKKPVVVKSGDFVRLTCTFDPTLRQKLPSLRSQPARYVTWGDGSTDEMCLATLGVTAN